jgi:arylsulfatase A
MVASLDRSIGRLRVKLDQLGIAHNTVVLLAGDNGGLDNEGRPTENAPLRAGKGTAYEGGVRTPTIAYWPGVTPRGSVSNEPVITMDLYATVLDIAGIELDAEYAKQVDGLSLTPILRDPAASSDARRSTGTTRTTTTLGRHRIRRSGRRLAAGRVL